MKKVLYVFLIFSDFIFELFKIKRNKIVISTFSPEVYCDNSKYLFEYLSKKKMDIYWFTNSTKIKKYLNQKKLKYISYNNIFHLFFIALKTKLVINSGSNYFNCFEFFFKKNIIKISLGHGMGNKLVLAKYIKTNNYENYSKFNYVNFTSDFSVNKIALQNYKIPAHKIIKLGYPRVNSLNIKINKKSNHKEIKKYYKNYNGEKILLYTPTWRPYSYNLPILNLKNFKIELFNNFLKKNKIIFLYTAHDALLPQMNNKLLKMSNFRYIDRNSYPLFDTTYFLNFVDILINDCSTTSTEFCMLKKPQLFIFPDYKKYKKTKGFVGNYFEELPGKFIKNSKNLEFEVLNSLKKNNLYYSKYNLKIKENLRKYYDLKKQDANRKFYFFIKKFI
jgi:CDP-glycerol glycerophosphotransferase (TagB/SpsB family)